LTFSPDNALLAAGSRGWITLWDVNTGKVNTTREVRSQFIEQIVFNADATLLALTDGDTVEVWGIPCAAQ